MSTNGIHLDIIIPLENVSFDLKNNLEYNSAYKYLSFGWGDENFYLNTPTWSDLTFSTAFKALFLKSATLMHVTHYQNTKKKWKKVKIGKEQLYKLNKYIFNQFKTDDLGNKIIIPNSGYNVNDNFYKANGSYSCFNTCNTWVNSAFKNVNLKARIWTPFDFSLINLYKDPI